MRSQRSEKETAGNQQERRGATDLPGQYRPIGIGAVAAALTAGGRTTGEPASDAANNDEWRHDNESLAA